MIFFEVVRPPSIHPSIHYPNERPATPQMPGPRRLAVVTGTLHSQAVVLLYILLLAAHIYSYIGWKAEDSG